MCTVGVVAGSQYDKGKDPVCKATLLHLLFNSFASKDNVFWSAWQQSETDVEVAVSAADADDEMLLCDYNDTIVIAMMMMSIIMMMISMIAMMKIVESLMTVSSGISEWM